MSIEATPKPPPDDAFFRTTKTEVLIVDPYRRRRRKNGDFRLGFAVLFSVFIHRTSADRSLARPLV
jgi:hypothetical protein